MMYKIRPEKPHTTNLKYWNRSMTLNTEAEQTRVAVKRNMYINQRGGNKIISMRRGKVYEVIKVYIVQRNGNYKWKYIFTDERDQICSSSHLSVFLENKSELRNSIIDNLLENLLY
jgi:hypothetical protein